MSMLPNLDVNSGRPVDTSNTIHTNDAPGENISTGMKEQIEEQTDITKMEQMQSAEKAKSAGKTDAKPESTLHKVGRWLSGIFGGLLLAAGIAAATVATLGGFGIAVGVAAAIAGTTGAAGIGLIATSARMRPKNPEALMKNAQPQAGKDEIGKVQNALKTKYGIDDIKVSDASIQNMDYILGQNCTLSKWTDFDQKIYLDFTSAVLKDNNLPIDLSKQNVLAVRLAIDKCFADKDLSDVYEKHFDVFNNPENKAQITKEINKSLEKYAFGSEEYKLLTLFRDAMNIKNTAIDIPAAPQDNAGNISTGQENIVSMKGGPDLGNLPIGFGPKGDKMTMAALKSLGTDPATVEGNDYSLDQVFSSIQRNDDLSIAQMSGNNITAFTETVLRQSGVKAYDLTPKNVLIVRHAIANFFGDKTNLSKHRALFDELNDPEGQKRFDKYLNDTILDMDKGNKFGRERSLQMHSIFRAAISQTNIASLSKNDNTNLLEQNMFANIAV